nr:immunoglobulin light chain junction region [Macaca mulatta]
CQQYKSNPHSF